MLSKKEEFQIMNDQIGEWVKLRNERDAEIARKQVQKQHDLLYPTPLPRPLIVPKTYDDRIAVTGTGTYFDQTGNTTRTHGPEVAKIVTNHGNGFFSDIRITQEDYIRFKLFRGGFIARLLHKLGIREPRNDEGDKINWQAIRNQSNLNLKLEAQLGKTYLKIDELIAEETKIEEHEKFIKGIAKTDPDNLKMIAGLKNLDDGMKAPLAPQEAAQTTAKLTDKKQKIINNATAGSWASNNLSLPVGGQEIIKIDPENSITFSEKMEEAMKKVMEAPESNEAP